MNIFKENEEEAKKPLIIETYQGVATLESLEFPDDFPIGKYTVFIRNHNQIFKEKLEETAFELVINPCGGGDDKKKKKK